MPIRLGGRKTRKRPQSFTSFWAGGEIRPRAYVSTRSLGGRKNLSFAQQSAVARTYLLEVWVGGKPRPRV